MMLRKLTPVLLGAFMVTLCLGLTVSAGGYNNAYITTTALKTSDNHQRKIDIEADEGAIVIVSSVSTLAGKNVRFSVRTEGDYRLRGIEITDESGNPVAFELLGEYRYSFIMPDTDVKISVKAEDFGNATNEDCILALYKLIVGEADHHTAKAKNSQNMNDLPVDTLGTDAALWAVSEEIIPYTDEDESFCDELISRELLATALYNFALKYGAITSSVSCEEIDTVDREFIADWAYKPVCWAVSVGILDDEGGTVGYFDPQGVVTRNELAQAVEQLSMLFKNNGDLTLK